ncbi:hypothetical protein D9M72_489770 [compost metagenome]
MSARLGPRHRTGLHAQAGGEVQQLAGGTRVLVRHGDPVRQSRQGDQCCACGSACPEHHGVPLVPSAQQFGDGSDVRVVCTQAPAVPDQQVGSSADPDLFGNSVSRPRGPLLVGHCHVCGHDVGAQHRGADAGHVLPGGDIPGLVGPAASQLFQDRTPEPG